MTYYTTGWKKLDINLEKLVDFCIDDDYETENNLNFPQIIQNLNDGKIVTLNGINQYIDLKHSSIRFNCTNSNPYKVFLEFKDKVNEHNRCNYYFNGQQIQTRIEKINRKKETYFDLRQISVLLGYSNSGYLLSYYNPPSNKYGYINAMDLQNILNRSRKPTAKQMIKDLSLDLSQKTEVKEANILNDIIDFIGDEEYKLQYACGKYRIDLYIPRYKIAIEVDENGHNNYDKIKETEREDYIKKNLTTKIVRINPDVPNFRIAKELGKLKMMMI